MPEAIENDLDFVPEGITRSFRVMTAGSTHDHQKDVGCQGGPHTPLPGRCSCMVLVTTLIVQAASELDAQLIAAQWMAGRYMMPTETFLCL